MGTLNKSGKMPLLCALKLSGKKTRPQAKIILACAPPKKGKFEFIIEKCTELGVDEIIPLKTKRTEVIFNADKMAGKLSRFEAVAVNAAKQSKGSRSRIFIL